MKYYIDVKAIEAEPMNLGEYNKFRGWTIPENEDPSREGYLVKYPADGHITWSPKEIFEKSCFEVAKDKASEVCESLKSQLQNM